MFTKIKNSSLSTKIIIMAVAILALQAGAGFYNIESLANEFKKEVNDSFKMYAIQLGDKISTQIYERYGDAQAFAMNEAVQSMDAARMQNDLNDYVNLYGLYDLIVVVDKNGKLVATNIKDVAGKSVNSAELKNYNFSNEQWFKSVLKGETTDDKLNNYAGTYVEGAIYDPLMKLAFGEERLGTSFSSVIKDLKGNIIGVISNRAGKRWFEAEAISLFDRLHGLGYKNLEITITNSEGKIISSLASDKKTSAMTIVTDPEEILKTNFIKMHNQAGLALEKQKTGAIISKYETDADSELVGYHHLNDKKWLSPLGWSVFMHDNQDDAYHDALAAIRQFYWVLAFGLFGALAIAVMFGKYISKKLNNPISLLNKNSDEVMQAAVKIADSSNQLSVMSRQQAAALQQTVTAVDEITATVYKNSDATDKSRSVSAESIKACETGRHSVEKVLSAISEIEQTNNMASSQMIESNNELMQITKLINDISSKTRIINEIVFQTKLLSFNASVEAARAGEYGKGFAVVAEEVGNLAKMSGEASKEISSLLSESTEKVNSIVSHSKSKVDSMIKTSNEKIRNGVETAAKCSDVLNIISNNVQSVDTIISEIATASREQAAGVKQISNAIGQMEQTTQQNAVLSQNSSAAAEQLRSQSESLNTIVYDLNFVISGEKRKNTVLTENTNNIFSLNSKKQKKESVVVNANVTKPVEYKKTGSSNYVPSSDDPGFGE